jgi:translation initiation factor 2B subunit (eIF-2B alpha/beta/delta family)
MKYFKEILKDNRSGSVQIVNNLIKELKEIIKNNPASDLKDAVIIDIKEVLFHHRGMLVLFHFINEFLLKIDEDYSKDELIFFLEDYEIKWQNINRGIIKNIFEENEFEGKKILLHSNSSTVVELFSEFKTRNIFPVVYQTISYPVKEGKIEAEDISKTGFEVYVFADGAAADIIKEIDFFICGADAIFKNSFVNKAGTFLYSLACDYFDKPVYILSDSRKIINEDYLPLKLRKLYTEFTDNDPDEIWKSPPEKIEILNRYFEKIPLKLINKIYSEKEILLPEDLLNKNIMNVISSHLL